MADKGSPLEEREDFMSLMARIDQQYGLCHLKSGQYDKGRRGVMDASDRHLFDSNLSSIYRDLKSWPFAEFSRVLIACGVDKSWALKYVGTMRETLRYHIKDADDMWSLARIDREIYSDDSDPKHYADMLRDDLGCDKLDWVCWNIAAGREWDYEPEPAKPAVDMSPPWEPMPVVTVDDSNDDVNVDISDDIPF